MDTYISQAYAVQEAFCLYVKHLLSVLPYVKLISNLFDYPLPFAMEEYKVNVGTRTLLLPFKRTNL